MQQRAAQQNRGGFTLVELLVVIAILAVMASILAPVFAEARGKVRGFVCLANLRQLGTTTVLYAQDYDEYFAAPGLEQGRWLPDLHLPYMKQWRVFICPMDGSATYWDGVWASPSFAKRTSYLWNAYLFLGDAANYRRSISQAGVTFGATTVVWADGYANAGWVAEAVPPSAPHPGYAYLHTTYGDSLNAAADDPSAAACRVRNGRHLTTAHAEGGNYSFADGHAKWFKPSAFLTQTIRDYGLVNDRTDPFVTNGARRVAAYSSCPVFCCPRDVGTPPGDGAHPWFRP